MFDDVVACASNHQHFYSTKSMHTHTFSISYIVVVAAPIHLVFIHTIHRKKFFFAKKRCSIMIAAILIK